MVALAYLSDYMVPLLIMYIVLYGVASKVKVYDTLINGARGGLKITAQICPVLVGLLVAISMFRESGALEAFTHLVGPLFEILGFPMEVAPLVIIKLFSSSAATGMLIDIFKEFGTDSYVGLLGSVCLASSETLFYTMTVYFAAVGITKTRWTLPGALIATLAGTIASTIAVLWIVS